MRVYQEELRAERCLRSGGSLHGIGLTSEGMYVYLLVLKIALVLPSMDLAFAKRGLSNMKMERSTYF